MPHPILIEFKTDKPVYPMRLTALANSSVHLELFAIAEKEAFPTSYGLRKDLCNYFDAEDVYPEGFFSGRFAVRGKTSWIVHPKASEILWDGCVLTKWSGKVASGEMKNDIRFEFRKTKPFLDRFHTLQGAVVTGLETTIIFWIAMSIFLIVLRFTGREIGGIPKSKSKTVKALVLSGVAVFAAVFFSLEKTKAEISYVSYKSGCASVEYDAQNILAALSCYFSEPSNTQCHSIESLFNDSECGDFSLINEQAFIKQYGTGNEAWWKVVVFDDGGCRRGRFYTTYMGTDTLIPGWR